VATQQQPQARSEALEALHRDLEAARYRVQRVRVLSRIYSDEMIVGVLNRAKTVTTEYGAKTMALDPKTHAPAAAPRPSGAATSGAFWRRPSSSLMNPTGQC
jgi:hypothetical protein